MEREIKDYLHFYLGCELRFDDRPNCKLTTLTLHQLLDGDFRFIKYWPILRPLSDMTDDEANDLEWYMWDGLTDACCGDRDEILKMFKGSTSEYRPGFEPMVLAINWLRNHSFDVDDLIESGLAIDATTLKQIKTL